MGAAFEGRNTEPDSPAFVGEQAPRQPTRANVGRKFPKLYAQHKRSTPRGSGATSALVASNGDQVMKPGQPQSPGVTTGSFGGALHIQTPSQAEHGPEGVLIFSTAKRVLSPACIDCGVDYNQ